jgi:hypothetical protein
VLLKGAKAPLSFVFKVDACCNDIEPLLVMACVSKVAPFNCSTAPPVFVKMPRTRSVGVAATEDGRDMEREPVVSAYVSASPRAPF